jgi:hypothetical protein
MVQALFIKKADVMLEIKKTAVSLNPEELIELERIIMDEDREGAYLFLKKSVYRRLETSQEGRLKSHFNGDAEPASSFQKKQ